MLADEQTYRNVAKNCSAYAIKNCCQTSNSTGSHEISCTTCRHFAADKHCTLDLFDPIIENHTF